MSAVRILPAGESALVAEFGDAIDPAINARVLAFDRAIAAEAPAGVADPAGRNRALSMRY